MSKYIKYPFFILILILIDQTSKIYFISYLKTKPGFVFNISPFLDFVYSWNYGISFGLFQEYYENSNQILLIVNSLIVLYLLYILFKAKSILTARALNLIIGGALGNLVDRIDKGAVFDFIYFNYNGYGFPAFNLADSFISIGAIIFIYDYFTNSIKVIK